MKVAICQIGIVLGILSIPLGVVVSQYFLFGALLLPIAVILTYRWF